MKVAVIHTGNQSAVLRRTVNTREWEAYRQNATDIAAALASLGHDARRLTDGRALIDALSELRPDLAWVCSGGIQGHDPATHLPGLLEMLGIDYVGSRPLSAGVADNKARAKVIVRAAGVRTPAFSIVPLAASPAPAWEYGYPAIVKPVTGMCSCGVSLVERAPELEEAVALLHFSYHNDVLIEQHVEGIDVTVGILQDSRGRLRCLPAVQRFFGSLDDPAFAQFALPHPHSFLREGKPVPAEVSDAQRLALHAMAQAAFAALGLRHYARLDFRVSGPDIWFLEANYKPDLTRNSLFTFSASLAGLDYQTLIREILVSAVHDEALPGAHRVSDGILRSVPL